MAFWVVTTNGTATGPLEELDAWIEQTRLIGRGAHASTLRVVKARNKTEALTKRPLHR